MSSGWFTFDDEAEPNAGTLGYRAGKAEKPLSENPYEVGTSDHQRWTTRWIVGTNIARLQAGTFGATPEQHASAIRDLGLDRPEEEWLGGDLNSDAKPAISKHARWHEDEPATLEPIDRATGKPVDDPAAVVFQPVEQWATQHKYTFHVPGGGQVWTQGGGGNFTMYMQNFTVAWDDIKRQFTATAGAFKDLTDQWTSLGHIHWPVISEEEPDDHRPARPWPCHRYWLTWHTLTPLRVVGAGHKAATLIAHPGRSPPHRRACGKLTTCGNGRSPTIAVGLLLMLYVTEHLC